MRGKHLIESSTPFFHVNARRTDAFFPFPLREILRKVELITEPRCEHGEKAREGREALKAEETFRLTHRLALLSHSLFRRTVFAPFVCLGLSENKPSLLQSRSRKKRGCDATFFTNVPSFSVHPFPAGIEAGARYVTPFAFARYTGVHR